MYDNYMVSDSFLDITIYILTIFRDHTTYNRHTNCLHIHCPLVSGKLVTLDFTWPGRSKVCPFWVTCSLKQGKFSTFWVTCASFLGHFCPLKVAGCAPSVRLVMLPLSHDVKTSVRTDQNSHTHRKNGWMNVFASLCVKWRLWVFCFCFYFCLWMWRMKLVCRKKGYDNMPYLVV